MQISRKYIKFNEKMNQKFLRKFALITKRKKWQLTSAHLLIYFLKYSVNHSTVATLIKQCKLWTVLSGAWRFVTPQTVTYHSPLSMGFPRQEYWSGLPFPSPGDLPDLKIEQASPVSPLFTTEPPGKPLK